MGSVKAMERIERAMDTVLRNAVTAKDEAVIEAYLEIYQKKRPGGRTGEPAIHAALRLGQLLGREVRRGE